jgi:hypothetical protein
MFGSSVNHKIHDQSPSAQCFKARVRVTIVLSPLGVSPLPQSTIEFSQRFRCDRERNRRRNGFARFHQDIIVLRDNAGTNYAQSLQNDCTQCFS